MLKQTRTHMITSPIKKQCMVCDSNAETDLNRPPKPKRFMVCWRLKSRSGGGLDLHYHMPNDLVIGDINAVRMYIIQRLKAPTVKGTFDYVSKLKHKLYAEIKHQDRFGNWVLLEDVIYE